MEGESAKIFFGQVFWDNIRCTRSTQNTDLNLEVQDCQM